MATGRKGVMRGLASMLMSVAPWVPSIVGMTIVTEGSGGAAVGQDLWTGEGADNLWSNPNNWGLGDPPTGGEIRVNGPEAEDDNGPLIVAGVEALAGTLIADAGNPVMTMTGGHLELTGWGTWWADAAGTIATFNMEGGVVDFTGDPGIMELGWQDPSDEPGSSVGIWNLYGGEVNAKGVDMPGKGNGGTAVINLWGGSLNVGSARGGLVMYEGGLLDITDGVLRLEGDQQLRVEEYLGNGWITAFGGAGDVVIGFDGDVTQVTAQSNAAPGDFNGNGQLDANDIDLLNAEIRQPTQVATYDLTQDGVLDAADRARWVKDLKKTWFGDADLDGEFNSGDFVEVFQQGEYEDAVVGNSTWSSGDWNGDAEFSSGDFVEAFQDGGFELGPRPARAAASVPEPTALGWPLLALFVSIRRRIIGQLPRCRR